MTSSIVRLFLVSVAASWTAVFVLLWGAQENGAGVLALALVPIATTLIVWARSTQSVPDPANRRRVFVAGVAVVAVWFVLLVPELGLMFMLALTAMALTGGGGIAATVLVCSVFLVAVGLAASWHFSRQVVRLGGPAPSVRTTTAVVAFSLVVWLGLPPLVAAYRKHRDAEAVRLRPVLRAAALAELQRDCDRGDSRGCFKLADDVQAGRYGAIRDAREALQLFVRACDLADPREPPGSGAAGCLTAGRLYRTGGEFLQDPIRATALFDRACTLGLAEACNELGQALASGEGAPKDPARAVALYEKSCPRVAGLMPESPPACASLGRLYLAGEGVAQDVAEALSLFQLACDNRSGMGCYQLGRLYQTGSGVPRDPLQAEAFYARSCRLEHLSESLDQGGCDGVAQECEGDSPRSCFAVAQWIFHDRPRAATLHRRACDAGEAQGCLAAGRLHETGGSGDGPKAPVDSELAKALYERGCELDSKNQACGEALRVDTAACQEGHAAACLRAARRDENAPEPGAVPRDLYLAANYYTRGCKLDAQSPACDEIRRLCASAGPPQNRYIQEFCHGDVPVSR